jgi:imidazolonepropionase-like amidohydrolase
VPGHSLHQEFDELARAGLSPLRILQTVTLDAAEFLGRDGTLGTVEEGKQADLVLLDANPVDDVAALHGIAGVVRAGRYHPAA